MEQNIGRAWHRRGSHCADDGIGGNCRFDFFGFEPPVENGIRRAGENFDCLLAVSAELAEIPPDFREPKQIAGRQ